jgi:predicted nuclease of predicted toxin-antitoxin system
MSDGSDRLYISLYLDEDVSDRLADHLRARGFQAESAWDLGTSGRTDEEQLTFATRRGSAVLTCNRNDFLQLARRWHEEGREHGGIVISQQFSRREIGEALRQVCALLNRVSADEMWNTVRYLQSYR